MAPLRIINQGGKIDILDLSIFKQGEVVFSATSEIALSFNVIGDYVFLSPEKRKIFTLDIFLLELQDSPTGQPYLFSGSVDDLLTIVNNSYLKEDNEAVIDPNLGFALFTDTVNDINNPQQITAGTPQVLTIVPSTPFVVGGADFLPVGASLWVSNSIRPLNGNNDTYKIRLTFKVDPLRNNQDINVKLDIVTGVLIHEQTIALAANRNTVSAETVLMDVFAGANFFANGGQIMIDGSNDFIIYEKVIKIELTRKTP